MTAEMKLWAADLEVKKNALKGLTHGKDASTYTPDDVEQAKTLLGEVNDLQAKLTEANAAIETMGAAAKAVADLEEYLKTPVNVPGFGGANPALQGDSPAVKQWAVAKRVRIKNFKDSDGITKEEKAYGFGQFLSAALNPGTAQGQKSLKWCADRGIPVEAIKVHQESINTTGGVLVPPQFDNDIVDLREEYGEARKALKNVVMDSDSYTTPRRTGGLTPYFVAETDAATESTKSWDQVMLTAKETRILSYITKNLSDDAFISVMDDLAGEMAYADALKEDNCAFNGDGTSTYGGMVGVRNRFINAVVAAGGTWATDAHKLYGAGISNAATSTWAGITLANFSTMKSKLPKYARNKNTAWYCHQTFFDDVMEKLMLAAGGITDAMIANGTQMKFMGFPVVSVQVMPSATAVSDIPVILGDLSLAAFFGDRRQTTIETSSDFRFTQREIAILSSERFDINWHDIGNASSTAASRVPGPVVALATLNSG